MLARCMLYGPLFVRPSLRLSQAGVMSKRLNNVQEQEYRSDPQTDPEKNRSLEMACFGEFWATSLKIWRTMCSSVPPPPLQILGTRSPWFIRPCVCAVASVVCSSVCRHCCHFRAKAKCSRTFWSATTTFDRPATLRNTQRPVLYRVQATTVGPGAVKAVRGRSLPFPTPASISCTPETSITPSDRSPSCRRRRLKPALSDLSISVFSLSLLTLVFSGSAVAAFGKLNSTRDDNFAHATAPLLFSDVHRFCGVWSHCGLSQSR